MGEKRTKKEKKSGQGDCPGRAQKLTWALWADNVHLPCVFFWTDQGGRRGRLDFYMGLMGVTFDENVAFWHFPEAKDRESCGKGDLRKN